MTSKNTTQSNVFYPVANGGASSNPFVWLFLARDPTSADVSYPIQKIWLNTTTNVLWFLKNFTTSNGIVSANWVVIENGVVSTEQFIMQTGTSPVLPNGSSQVTFSGAVVAAGTHPVRTDGTGPNTMTLEVQTSQAIASTDATKIGLSAFNSGQFSVDANGFVSATGSVALQFTGTTGTATPSAGNINLLGASTAAGTTPVSTTASSSTVTVDVQKSQAIASTDATKIGLSVFNSANFTVDANGFVSVISGGGSVVTQVFTTTGTYTPTSGMKYCIVECVGGGGGGGGCPSTGASTVAAGGGGGSGGYCRRTFSAATIGVSQSVTIGAGGAGGVGNSTGTSGGDTLFGAFMTGGQGVGGASAAAAALTSTNGGEGGTSTGGDINGSGSPGGSAFGVFSTTYAVTAGFGASSIFGGGRSAQAGTSIGANGNSANNYGGGGAGGANGTSQASARNGGNGSSGIVIVTEFVNI